MQKRILIVDNDRASVAPLREELERQGRSVMMVEEGETGLRQIRESRPDTVILELNLPYQDGFEIIPELRAKSQFFRLPILIYTSRPDTNYETMFRYFGSGADCYLPKPGYVKELIYLIGRMTDGENSTEGD